MRIGIDARLWDQTGVGRYIRNLVQHLGKIDKKNTYFLFCLEQDCENIKSQISNLKYDNFRIIGVSIKWHSISEQINFPRVLNAYDLDLMHFPYFSVPVFYNKPFVVTIHDLIIHHFPTGKASTLILPLYGIKLLGYKYVIKRSAQKAKKIIAVSNATKEEIIDHLKVQEDKIEVIYEAADDKVKFKVQSSRFKVAGKYFLYVGNAYPHKNLERLIEAFSGLRIDTNDYSESKQIEKDSGSKQIENDSDTLGEKISKNSDLKLVLAGKKDYFYKRLEEKYKSGNIIFYGKVTDEELSSLYKGAIAVVLPSLMEGFGLPILEAMSNNCPVLASDIPLFREVGQDAVIYFDPYSVSDMTEKMKDVCSNDLNHRNKNKENGLLVAKKFSWEKTASETLALYEQAVRGKK